jgi:hypothetical protein
MTEVIDRYKAAYLALYGKVARVSVRGAWIVVGTGSFTRSVRLAELRIMTRNIESQIKRGQSS